MIKMEDPFHLSMFPANSKRGDLVDLNPDRSLDFQNLIFIEPDERYFINNGQTKEETINFVLQVLKAFGNDPETISEFMKRTYNSRDVVFALFHGSAVNTTALPSEIEDVDILIATKNRKFVYGWDQPKGTEIHYLFQKEIENFLKVEKRFFVPVFKKEYNALGGIFANGVLAIKFSKELEDIIQGVRRHFQKVSIKALSQMVENDCKKKMKRNDSSSRKFSRYSFYGTKTPVSLDKARLMIDESIKRKNIQPGIAPAITRKILKGIKKRKAYEVSQFT